MDEKTIEEVFDSIFGYAKKIMKEEETTTVYFSQIGYMYVYRGVMRKLAEKAEAMIERYGGERLYDVRKINKIKFLDKQLEGVKGFSKHKAVPVLRSRKLKKGMNFEELENFQNNEAEDKKHRKGLY